MDAGQGAPLTGIEHLADGWPVWRLIFEGVATLQEVEQHWSIDDVLDANEMLDAKAEAQAAYARVQADQARRGQR